MTILARYTPKNIIVEVVDVLTAGNRKRVLIRATQGEPFYYQSHGGPVDTDSAIVSPDHLADIEQVQEAPRYPRRPRYKETTLGKLPTSYSAEELERFSRIPCRANTLPRRESTARGGMNND